MASIHSDEARRWLNTAERADPDQAAVPALIAIGHALLAINEAIRRA